MIISYFSRQLDRTNSTTEFKFHSLCDPHMPLIAISMYPGRTKEQKEAFAKAITNLAVEILKTKAQDVIVTYDEREKENWYISGEPL
jgi:4-oxalocrotonate tautomerase